MSPKIRVAILDDHQSTIDGYSARLNQSPVIEIVGTANFGEELEPLLTQHPADVLLLDIGVSTAPQNDNPYPILHIIPRLLQKYPRMAILVISMRTERTLIHNVMEAGASGYILKDDRSAAENLEAIVRSVASGGVFWSQKAREYLAKKDGGTRLTPRQLEALSLYAAYPDCSLEEIATKLSVSYSGARNLLWQAYVRLDVHTRAAAIAKAQTLGLITPLDV